MNLPEKLDEALARWMAANGTGSQQHATTDLQRSYRKGETSSHVNCAAYVATRLPATFAANRAVHAALAEAMSQFKPRSLLDVGTGPGVASWAALAAWPALTDIVQCEQDKTFADLAETLNGESGIAALEAAVLHRMPEASLPDAVSADLVVASYMLAELPVAAAQETIDRLWSRTRQVLVLIEPGTPQGFERLRRARLSLVRHVIAPCTHHQACPVQSTDWCHFKTRLARSREHMHAKQARVPFEDEAFSYLILSRGAVPAGGARIIRPPRVTKAVVSLSLCTAYGTEHENVERRDRAKYKRAKKAEWGGTWE